MKQLFIFTIIFVISSASFAQDNMLIDIKTEKYTLKNGLTVILHENHSASLYSFHQWFRVGSINEVPGRTGLAHFFEHLMFKGTEKISRSEFEKSIKINGGVNNAFTSSSYTGYYENMPSGTLELILKTEADRMVNLLFDPAAIASEREVVKEERRLRVENSVMGSLYQAMTSTLFKVSNYRWPVVGYMKDLNAATLTDFKSFYKTFYSPNNAVMVIAGDFESKKVKKLIKKYYGNLKRQTLPKLNNPKEPLQKSSRKQNIYKEVQAPTVAIAYHTPEIGNKDLYALDVLSVILGGGASSRLDTDLNYKKQLVTRISCSSSDMKHGGMFYVIASLRSNKNRSKVERLIYSHIAKVVKNKVTEAELEKAKNTLMLSEVSPLSSLSDRAHTLAYYEVVYGDHSLINQAIKNYMDLSIEDIHRVAKTYLNKNQSSVIRVLPKK